MKNRKYEFVLYFFIWSLVLISCVIGYSHRIISDLSVKETGSVGNTDQLKYHTVIIDAGHGGEDCGAVGFDGTLEKDLNLILASQIKEILMCHNIKVIMTRTEDKLLYSEQENIKGQRKIYDLKNRYLIAKDQQEALFISIHMNKFPQSMYSGLQVYYSQNNQKSKILADSIQNNTITYLQKDNNRKIKPSDNSIYLLDRLQIPAVLVECGFLSNERECQMLNDKAYRKQLATVISNSIMENLY